VEGSEQLTADSTEQLAAKHGWWQVMAGQSGSSEG